MKMKIEFILKGLIFASFFVPLVRSSSYLLPTITPKVYVLRSVIELMLGAYLLLLIINWREYRPKLSLLNIAMLLFLCSLVISTVFSLDVHRSFWDTYVRMLGLFSIAHYIVFYFICSSIFKTWDDWKWALRIFVFAGGIAMIAGMAQVDTDVLIKRISGTTGNPIYFGGYGLFLFFASCLLIIKEESRKFKIIATVFATVALAGVFLSGSRGVLVALFIGAVAVAVWYAIVLKEHRRMRQALLILVLAMTFVASTLFFFRSAKFVSSIPGIGRLAGSSFSAADPRILIWKGAVQAWKNKPLLGWGPNNFFYANNQYYNPHSLGSWSDNAHNVILNTLVEQGAVGLAIYLFMFSSAVFTLIWAKKRGCLDIHIVIWGAMFLVAHLLKIFTVFEDPISYLYLMFWLAMVNSLASPQTDAFRTVVKDRRLNKGIIAGTCVVCMPAVFFFNIQPSRTDRIVHSVMDATPSNISIWQMKQAVADSNNPHSDSLTDILGYFVGNSFHPGNIEKIGREKVKDVANTVHLAMKKCIVAHPLNAHYYITATRMLAVIDYAEGGTSHVAEQIGYLEEAHRLSPQREWPIYFLAKLYVKTGRGDEAEKMFLEAINNNPDIDGNYLELAKVYMMAGKKEKAQEVFETAREQNVAIDPLKELKILSHK